jgi:hypothetical protein
MEFVFIYKELGLLVCCNCESILKQEVFQIYGRSFGQNGKFVSRDSWDITECESWKREAEKEW